MTIAEPAGDQVSGLLGLDGFICEEINRKISQPDQPREQVNRDAQQEQPDSPGGGSGL